MLNKRSQKQTNCHLQIKHLSQITSMCGSKQSSGLHCSAHFANCHWLQRVSFLTMFHTDTVRTLVVWVVVIFMFKFKLNNIWLLFKIVQIFSCFLSFPEQFHNQKNVKFNNLRTFSCNMNYIIGLCDLFIDLV